MRSLVEWDSIELRVDGERINEMVGSEVGKRSPIEKLTLRFGNGFLRVEGVVRKFIAVPFQVDIREILCSGTTIRVPLGQASAFGAIPIPQFLFRFAKDRLPKHLAGFEEPATLVLSLDRFLPPNVTTEIQKIWIIEGGLAVTLGRGGADLPAAPEPPDHDPQTGGSDGTDRHAEPGTDR